MKKMTIFALFAAIVFLVGCGGSNGGSSTGDVVNDTSGGTEQTAGETLSGFDARNLSDYSVILDDRDSISDEKQVAYIYETGTQVKIVKDMDNGDQYVYEGTYEIKDFGSDAKVLDMNVALQDGTTLGFSLMLDNEYHINEYQFGFYVTKVVENSQNGIVIKDSDPVSGAGALTIQSVDDVLGYRITSNEAVYNYDQYEVHQTINVSFHCDGTFDYTITMTNPAYGITTTEHSNGDSISVDTTFDPHSLSWHGIDDEGETMNDSIDLDMNDQIIANQTCWTAYSSGGTCANDLHVAEIVQEEVCN